MERDTIPYWIGTTKDTNYPELMEDMSIDVAVVGLSLIHI